MTELLSRHVSPVDHWTEGTYVVRRLGAIQDDVRDVAVINVISNNPSDTIRFALCWPFFHWRGR